MRTSRLVIALTSVWVLLCLVSMYPQAQEWRTLFGALSSSAVETIHHSLAISVFIRNLALVGATLVIGMFWMASGRTLGTWVGMDSLPEARTPAALLIGLAAQGAGLLALSLCGLSFPFLIVAAMVVPMIGWLVCNHVKGVPRFQLGPPNAFWGPAVIALLPALIASGLAFAPDVLADVLTFHLATPEKILHVHKLSGLDTSLTSEYPLTGELNYCIALILGQDALAHLIQLVPFGAALILLFIWCSRVGGGVGAGWLAVVGVLSSTRITAQFMVAKNDLIEAAYVVAAGSFMLSGRGRGARIAAIFFGCAAATKYTGLVSLATGIGWLIFSLPKKQWAEMVCFGILPFVPWAVKSWLFTGDPAWPLLAAWLPGALWDPATAGAIHAMRGGSLVSDLLAMGPKHFESLVLYAPAVAVMSPMAALAFRSSERRVRQLAAYTVVTAIAMYCALPWQAMRYAIPFHILWTGLVSAGTFRVVAAWPRTQRLAGAWGLAILVLVATPRLLAERADIGARCTYLLGGYTKQELYRARMTSMADAHDALKGLADVRRVMYAGELRYLHMPGQHLGDRGPGQGLIWMASKESQTPGEIVKKFRQVNCRHILLNFVTEAYPHIGASSFHWDDRMLALWRTFTGRYLKLMAVPQNVDNHNGGFAIYELREKPLSRDPLWLPYMPGIEGLLIEVSQFGQSGNLSGWITAARQIYRRVPDVDLIRDQLALGLRLQGSWGEAWRLYKVGIDHGTLTGTNLFDAAVCAASLGQFAAAEKLLHRCAEVTPQLRPQVEIALADLAQRYR